MFTKSFFSKLTDTCIHRKFRLLPAQRHPNIDLMLQMRLLVVNVFVFIFTALQTTGVYHKLVTQNLGPHTQAGKMG